MKIVRYYFSEDKAVFASIENELADLREQLTEEERETVREEVKTGFEEIAALAAQMRIDHPRVVNQEKKQAFEELARQALDYAEQMNLDIEVDFDAGMSGIISMESDFIMCGDTWQKNIREFIPRLMTESEEYCISKSQDGASFIMRFTFPYYDEL